jgi:hypothetical protein
MAAAGGALVGLVVVAGFGPLVRWQARRTAERWGAKLEIEHLTPTWSGVALRGVDVELADVPSAKIRFEEVDVALRSGGKGVVLRGGNVRAVGPREQVLREVEAWRAKVGTREGASGGSGGGSREFVGLDVSWQNDAKAPTEAVSTKDLQVTRVGDGVRVSASKATLASGRATVDVDHGSITLAKRAGGYRVKDLSASGLDAAITLAAPAEDPDDESEGAKPATKPASHAKAAAPTGASRGERIRAQVLALGAAVSAVLDDGAKVHLAGVRAKVLRGKDKLNLGPGALTVARSSERLVIELSPELGRPGGITPAAGPQTAPKAGDPRAPREAEQALTFRLSVPLSAKPAELVADVKGGPIWLSTLGIREGDFGLFDVARASLETRSHVVLSADGKTLTLDGDGRVHGLSLRNERLSDEPVAGLELAWRAKGELDLDGSRVRVVESEVDLGSIRLLAQGSYDRDNEKHRVHGTFEMPLSACQAMLDSAPRGLVPKLKGVRMAGSFALKGRVRFDTANLDKTYKAEWDLSNSCRVTEAPPEIHVDRFKKPFRRTVYTPEGRPTEIESGPQSPGWVPLGAISKFMETAVLTTEDGGFYRHRGFDQEAIRNSIRENLRKMRFVRGASTISMQLAKNLYLDRTKNVSRKLQEAVFTMYLEQDLTKEQILELYLNCVEFGPMVYGIGPAAQHYFSTTAGDLSLGQSLYISSILPNPKQQKFVAGGAVSPGWMSYLHKLMRIAYDRKRISEEDLEEGLRETVIKGSRAPQREPRSPNEAGHGADLAAEPGEWSGP